MGWLAAALFRRVQAADFYHDLHHRAVALLPPGSGGPPGRAWLDIGSGPGLLARLAALRGYTVIAADRDPAMTAAAARHPVARVLVASGRLSVRTAALEDLAADGPVAVVSAASLLAVVPDRAGVLRQMLGLLAPDGHLLVVEPSARMALWPALRWLWHSGGGGRGGLWLLLWAATRRRGRAVRRAALEQALATVAGGWQLAATPLLGGLVTAWVISCPPPARREAGEP